METLQAVCLSDQKDLYGMFIFDMFGRGRFFRHKLFYWISKRQTVSLAIAKPS